MNTNRTGAQVMAHLYRSRMGNTTSMAVPTTIVGQKVIRGSAIKKIQAALVEQNK